jgi:hypothetical protein
LVGAPRTCLAGDSSLVTTRGFDFQFAYSAGL